MAPFAPLRVTSLYSVYRYSASFSSSISSSAATAALRSARQRALPAQRLDQRLGLLHLETERTCRLHGVVHDGLLRLEALDGGLDAEREGFGPGQPLLRPVERPACGPRSRWSASSVTWNLFWVSSSRARVSSISWRDEPMVWTSVHRALRQLEHVLDLGFERLHRSLPGQGLLQPLGGLGLGGLPAGPADPRTAASWRSTGFSAVARLSRSPVTFFRAPERSSAFASVEPTVRATSSSRCAVSAASCRSADARVRCSVALSSAPCRWSSSWPSSRIRSCSSSSCWCGSRGPHRIVHGRPSAARPRTRSR